MYAGEDVREATSSDCTECSSLSSPAYTVYNRISQCSSVLLDISPTLCPDSFLGMLQSNVQIAYTSTKDITKSVTETLVRNWVIGLAAAKRTVKDTTHRVLRTVAPFDLTYDSPEWNPHTIIFNQQEKVAQDTLDAEDRELHSVQSDVVASLISSPTNTVYNRISQCSSVLLDIYPTLCTDSFLGMLQLNVQIAYASTKDSTKSTTETLVRNWGIGLAAARRTVKATTHRVIRTVAHASLSRRFRTNDRQLRYRRINAEMFTDTAKSAVQSKRGNKYIQIYSMPFG